MTLLRNVGPLGALEIAPLGDVRVEAGATVEVPDDLAAALLLQPELWAPATPSTTNPAATGTVKKETP